MVNDLENVLRSLTDDGPAGGPSPVGGRGPQDLADGALRQARSRRRRRRGAAITAAAALSVVTVAIGVQGQVLRGDGSDRFGPGPVAGRSADEAWSAARVNVLMLGTDTGTDTGGGQDRGTRPDTLVVASIDTRSGDTVLVSLPRNLQRVPFPPGSPGARQFPEGFSCPDARLGVNTECLLNGLWTWAQTHPQYYPGDQNPGRTATVQAVQQVTGLTVDEVVVVNLRGLASLVDAVGGVDITVTQRLPIGGNAENRVAGEWLTPGRHHLDGYHALWFARSRWSTSDFDRMRRQRCLISALARQVDAGSVAARLPQLLATLRGDLSTTIPLDDLPRWAKLAARIREARVTSLVLDDTAINTVRPDIAAIHRMVTAALTGTGSGGDPASASVAPKGPAQDTDAICQG